MPPAPERPDEPADAKYADHHPWMKWKSGSTVRLKITGLHNDEKLMTLRRVGRNEYDIEIDHWRDGRRIMITKHTADPGYACAHCDSDAPRRDTKRDVTYSREVGVPIAVEEAFGLGSWQAMSAVKMDDVVTVAGRDVNCVRLEGSGALVASKGGDITIERWLSADVPGWLVKEIWTCRDWIETTELVEFEARR